MSTVKAPFGGWVEPVNLDQGSTIPLCFVFQLGHKLRPTYITNRLCKAVILDHVLDCQTLDTDRLVFTDQACRKLVKEVRTSVSNTGMNTSNLETSFVSVPGTFLLFRVPTLGFCQLLLVFGEEFRIANCLTRRENDKGFQPKISSYSLLSGWILLHLCFYQNTDEIAISAILGDSGGGWGSTFWQGTRPDNIERFRHLSQCDMPITIREGGICIGSRLSIALLLKCRILSSSLKEVDEGPIQMAKGLLQRDRGNIIQPCIWRLFLEVSELMRKIIVVQAHPILIVGVCLLAQCPIVDKTRTPKGLSKNILLFIGGIHPVLICSLHVLHFNMKSVRSQPSTPPYPPQKAGPYIPALKGRGFTGRLIKMDRKEAVVL